MDTEREITNSQIEYRLFQLRELFQKSPDTLRSIAERTPDPPMQKLLQQAAADQQSMFDTLMGELRRNLVMQADCLDLITTQRARITELEAMLAAVTIRPMQTAGHAN